MLRPKPRAAALFLLSALVLTPLLTYAVRRASARSASATAQSLQRWSHSNGGYTVTVLSDGTLVTSGDGPAHRIRPQDGEVLSNNFPEPDIRPAVWAAEGSRPDYLLGGYQDRRAVTSEGSVAWEWIALGCCNGARFSPAVDHAKGLAYFTQNNTLYAVELATGSHVGTLYAGDFYGFTSVPEPGVAYVAGIFGSLARVNLNTGATEWGVTIDSGKLLQSGAVAPDGSVVVSSGSAHLIPPNFEPGRLARVMPDGTVAWNLHVNAVTPPVVGADGIIYVGTQGAPTDQNGAGAIEARDPQTGALLWSTAVEGLPNDLLLGDDGAVYAGTGAFARGSVYALDRSTGGIRQTITNVPGAWEIVLRGGLLFASGGAVTALPVAATDYDPSSPWPVRLHDNQRTGNRQAPHLTAPREPAPQPSPAACPSNIGGLVAYWSADGNAQDSNGNLSGVNVGGVTYGEGKRGRAFKFEGNYVSVPQKVYSAQGGTLELWFNWDGANASQAQAITGSYGGGAHASPGLYVLGGGLFSFYGDAGPFTNVMVTPGEWNHAAVTYDAAHNVRTYVNGALVNEYTASDPNPFFDELQIGRCTNCTFPGFGGLVDEMRVYDRPLTASEIRSSFEGVNSVGCPSTPTPTPTPTPAPTPPFQITIDPGPYAGDYTVLGTNQTRPSALSLMPGVYHFDNGSGGRFTFEVNASGQVTNIQTPSAAHASGSTLFLHASELVIDPQNFTGRLWLLGQNPHQTKAGLQSFSVVPGMAYQVDLGGNDRVAFNVSAGGDVTDINNPPAAHADANRLVLNNAVLSVEPQAYTGTYFPGSHANLAPFRGAQSIVLVPNMRYFLSVGDLHTAFWFRLDASGQVTGVENPSAAYASGGTLVLRNVPVAFDPQAYAGFYYPHTHAFQDFRGGPASIVLVPNLTYPVSVGDFHSHFRFTLGEAGQLVSVDNPAAAFVRDDALVLRNACVSVNPGGLASDYEMILVGHGRGPKTFTLVPSMRYYFRDGANEAQAFTLDDAGRPTPASVAVALGGQTYDFTLAPVACDQTPPDTLASLSSQPNGAGWHDSNVTVSLDASDETGGTGVRDITYAASGAQTIPQTTAAGASAPLALTAEGETVINYFATDRAGNREASKTLVVKIDKTAPDISADADAGGGTYRPGTWTNRDVTVSFGCADAVSGVSEVTGPVTLDADGANQTADGLCTDSAGNHARLTFGDVDIDKTAPQINLLAPTQGAGYTLGQLAPADYACSDAGSGVTTCAGTNPVGAPVDTASVGTKTFTVQATDRAGNSSGVTVAYTVGYGVCPLFDQSKAYKSGSTIPVKLRLCDAGGNNLSSESVALTALGAVRLSDYAPGQVEDSGNANPDDNFRFADGKYLFNLKTAGLSTGSYLLVFRAGAASATHAVRFQIK
jgi:hypothetical protein